MSTIAGLKSKISKLNRQLKELKERKIQLSNIQLKIRSTIPGYIDKANNKMAVCAWGIYEGVAVSNNAPHAVSQVLEKKHGNLDEDSSLIGVNSYISKEVSRLNKEIRSVENSIVNAQKELKKLEKQKCKETLEKLMTGGVF